MLKKKEQKIIFRLLRYLARLVVITLPTTLILIAMVLLHKITWTMALSGFAIVATITGVITKIIFHDQENFITYLRNMAQGIDAEPPRFHIGLFGLFRLFESFLSVKNLWSEQTLSDATILENLPDPLLMVNQAGEIVFSNTAALDFFGSMPSGTTATETFKGDIFATALTRILTQQTPTEWFEWPYEEPDGGQTYTFQVRLERLPAPAKNKGIAVIVMHDITPFKLFKQQQSDFFANASHELKTPLSILSGFIETLQGPAKDDEVAREKFLKMMAEQTERMTHLVQDLLKLSRLQMTEKTNQNDVILLPDLLQGVVEGLRLKAENNHKTLELYLLHDLPRLIGNRNELYQVFQNLIDNAIKYGANNTAITIKAHLRNGFPKTSERYLSDLRQVIAISVHNRGEPIPKQNINRLFERFYRVDSIKSRRIEGTGLGLGIAQQIVHKHDGYIDVNSSASQGTTFTVYLPIDL